MTPIVTNICHRCGSDKVEVHKNGIYTCKECGKADKAHNMKLKFIFPREDGEPEVAICRHLAREMAGSASESVGTAIAVGLGRAAEEFSAKIPPDQAKILLSRSVAAAFNTMFDLIVPFLPIETQQELSKTNAMITRVNALLKKAREEEAKNAEGVGGATGEAHPQGDGTGSGGASGSPHVGDGASVAGHRPEPSGDLKAVGGESGS